MHEFASSYTVHPSIITCLLTQITQNYAYSGIPDFKDSGFFLDGIPNRH